jgi:phospholipid/cholesterol/gamma-HCH transport system substrate-binding protein
MKKFLTPVKVGIVALVTVAGLVYSLRSVREGAFSAADTYPVYALFDNVLGVATRSRVSMAGVEVGYIESIELEGGRARVNLRIRNDVPLFRDAEIAKISESLLGDKLLELSPGRDREHPLAPGSRIENTYEEKDFPELFRQMDGITRDIRTVTESLSKTIGQMDREDSLGGVMRNMNKIADNVTRLTERVNQVFDTGSTKVERILDDLSGISAGTRGRYGEILDNIRDVTRDMKALLANLNDIVGRGEGDFKESVGGFKQTLEKANRSLENLDQITQKINEGEGTLGRLVNDDKLLAKAEGILSDVSSITSPIGRLQLLIDLHSEYHVNKNAAKNYLALKLIPKSDKYYMVEVIDDPRGDVEVIETCNDTSRDCSDPANRTKSITVRDKFKFSLQFEKRFFFLGLRFGIMENTGGLGADFFLFNDDLQLRLDLFQFGKNEFGTSAAPRLKAMLLYRPTWLANHIYLVAGGDDFFNGRKVFDYFFGAGLSFTDDDLKGIITATGVPSP